MTQLPSFYLIVIFLVACLSRSVDLALCQTFFHSVCYSVIAMCVCVCVFVCERLCVCVCDTACVTTSTYDGRGFLSIYNFRIYHYYYYPDLLSRPLKRARYQDQDLGHQVSRPRPRPWQSGLETKILLSGISIYVCVYICMHVCMNVCT